MSLNIFMKIGIKAFKKAIELAGGQTALGRKINRPQNYIHKVANRNHKVPAEIVLKVEKAVGGAVTRYQLRPDLYPRE